MKTIECVIFDCDGVLVDSEPISNRIFYEKAKSFGFSKDLDFILRNFSGKSIQDCIHIIEEDIGDSLPENFVDEFRKEMYEAFKKELEPIDGVVDVVKSLNVPFGVASSGPRKKIESNLELIGLFDQFNPNIFSCYEIGKWKPDPAIFLYAAESMGFNPENCLVVEDSITGVKAAKAGGFEVFAYVHEYHYEKLKQANIPLFHSMKNLGEELVKLNLVHQ